MSLSVLQRYPTQLPKNSHTFPLPHHPSYDRPFVLRPHRRIESNSTASSSSSQRQDSSVPQQAEKMSLQNFPMELVHKIYDNCSEIQSLINLSATCRRFHGALTGGYKIKLIDIVLERQYGPLSDVKQLITYNSSQPVHAKRDPSMSLALAEQIVRVGVVVKKWENLYPMLRWRDNSDERRFLTNTEAYRFRRAMYRWWLYAKAYHSEDWASQNNTQVLIPSRPDSRVDFFRPFNYYEICEIGEVFDVLYEMVLIDLAPSDAIMQSRYEQITSSREILYFGTYDTHQTTTVETFDLDFRHRHGPNQNFRAKLPHDFVRESWGPSGEQIFKVLRIMQLDPQELLHFRDNLTCKADRVDFLSTKSHWWNRSIASTRTAISFALARRNQHFPSRSDTEGGILDYRDKDMERNRALGRAGNDTALLGQLGLEIFDYVEDEHGDEDE